MQKLTGLRNLNPYFGKRDVQRWLFPSQLQNNPRLKPAGAGKTCTPSLFAWEINQRTEIQPHQMQVLRIVAFYARVQEAHRSPRWWFNRKLSKSPKGGQCFDSPGETGSLKSMYRSSYLHSLRGKYTLNLQMNRGILTCANQYCIHSRPDLLQVW